MSVDSDSALENTLCVQNTAKLVNGSSGNVNLIPIQGHSSCFWFTKWIHENYICVFSSRIGTVHYRSNTQAFVSVLLLLKINIQGPKLKLGWKLFCFSVIRPLLRDHTHVHNKSQPRSLSSLQIWEKRNGICRMLGWMGYLASLLRQVNAKALFQPQGTLATQPYFTPGEEELQFWAGSKISVVWAS